MRVLYCVSEVAPIIKVGGLGDVAGSLPKALARLGVDIRVVVPKYQEIDTKILGYYDTKKLGEAIVVFAGVEEKVIICQTVLPQSEVPVYLLENETYLSKDGHQAFAGTEKEIERFAFFSKSIAEIINTKYLTLNTDLDLVHLNDWHTSLIPLLLAENRMLPTVLTVHNLYYQGIAGIGLLKKLGISSDSCKVLKWDAQNRDIDILMEGTIHATLVNTVSPTYAKEIMGKEYGWGMEEVLKGKEGRVVGILNGIDYEVWNPAKDKLINFQFSLFNFQLGKAENKKILQKELGLVVNANLPLLAFIGRLEPKQKGLDILYETLEKLLPVGNFRFILLGIGDKEWEEKFRVQSLKFKEKMVFICRFDERLAHQIYAAADTILVPSLFEPCGLPQMIGMRYGALPIVRKTGGLADTVIDNETGFVFKEYSSEALVETIVRAIRQSNNQALWERMVRQAMSQDFSWESSARKYLEIYRKAIEIEKSKK